MILTKIIFRAAAGILFLAYDIIFLIGFILYLPLYVFRRKISLAALREKVGFIPKLRESVWIQVVSVGEANLIGSLIKRLRELFDYPLVISTTTLTGYKVATKMYASSAKIIFFPLDVSLILSRVLNAIKPKIFIAVETEMWPNLFYRLRRRGIPIVIINGRISRHAFSRYRLIKPLISGVINLCSYIGVQNVSYKAKFLSLGAREEKIIVSGNMKFESIQPLPQRLLSIKNKYIPLLKRDNSLLIVAGSLHYPEEEVLLNAYGELKRTTPGLSLLLAPRHTERAPSIEKAAAALGFYPVRISKADTILKEKESVFILDTVGDLLYFYALADICFVGGSLVKYGGHNILEPIYFLKPTCFGPYMDNFKDIEEVVLEKGAGIKVKDSWEFKEVLLGLVKDEVLRSRLRLRCLKVFEDEKKSLEANLKIILKCLS